jgi:hypothetical protein
VDAGLKRLHPRGIAPWAVLGLLGLLASGGFLLTSSLWVKAALHVGVYTLSAVLMARAWRSSGTRGAREPVLLALLAGAVLFAVSSLGWWYVPLLTGRPLPAPSPVDALYFCAYGSVGVYLLMLGRRNRRSDPRGALDALIIALGLTPTGYLLLVNPVVGPIGSIGLAEATFLAYPYVVALLVSLALWVAVVAARRSAAYGLLMGWLGTELIGDVIYGRTGAAGTFSYGQSWQALYVLSATCLGALALHPGLIGLATPSSRPAARARTRLLVLGAAVAAPTAPCSTSSSGPTTTRSCCCAWAPRSRSSGSSASACSASRPIWPRRVACSLSWNGSRRT